MLVLDRKVHEGFWIDGRIFVKVLSVGRRRVKLGIEAPPDVEVVREELRERGPIARPGPARRADAPTNEAAPTEGDERPPEDDSA